MTTLQIQISVTPAPPGLAFDGRGFIAATNDRLKKICGGCCVGVATDAQITVEMRGDSREHLTAMIETYCDHFRKEQRQVQILVVESPKVALSENELADGARLNMSPAKLTKAFFMNQAESTFLASNIMGRDMEPAFAEVIEGSEGRLAQWDRIRAAGADQRACHVFPTEAHFKRWRQEALDYFRTEARRESDRDR